MEMNVNYQLIKELRLKKSWSQEKLAEKAGLSLRTIQRIETDGVASLHSRAAVSAALEIEPAMLDVELDRAIDKVDLPKLDARLFLQNLLRTLETMLRGIVISFASIISATLFAIAVSKPFMPDKVGLFTSDTSMSIGIVDNTVNMQEHLGYWIVPLALLVAWGLFRCVLLLLNRKRTET